MAEDAPEIGMVIRHLYLWRDEKAQGQEEGRKARPCVIVHTRQNEFDETEVLICPITHTQPAESARAIEIPHATKQRLKLDDKRSWIITGEVNRFTWQGPDVVQTQFGSITYGYLPHGLAKAAVEKVKDNARERSLGITDRDDEALKERLRGMKRRTRTEPSRGKDRER